MLQILKEKHVNTVKERESALQQLESKYAYHIHALLQQKILIAATIRKQYDEMLNTITDSIINNAIQRNPNGSTPNNNTKDQNPQIELPLLDSDITSQSNCNQLDIQPKQNSILHIANIPNPTLTHVNKNIKNKSISKQHRYKPFSRKFKDHAVLYIYVPAVNLKCKKCKDNKLFPVYQDFENHMKINHNISKPYECTQHNCDKSYSHKNSLLAHIRSRHMKEINYKCNVCAKGFFDKDGWKRHMASHSDERPFKCDECGKAYKRRNNLTGHIRKTHNKQAKLFECNICRKQFASKDHWLKHCGSHSLELIT
eukprot:293613_1